MRSRVVMVVVALLALVGGLWWRRSASPPPAPSTVGLAVAFPLPGLVTVTGAAGRHPLTLLDEAGRRLAVTPPFAGELAELRVAWQPGESYRLLTASGAAVAATAPPALPELEIRLHAPLGQAPRVFTFAAPFAAQAEAELSVPVTPGQQLDLLLTAELLRQAPPLELHVTGDLPFAPAVARLGFEFDQQLWSCRLPVPDPLPTAPLRLRLRAGELDLPVVLHLVPRAVGPESLELVAWDLPTTRGGEVEPRHVADRVALPNATWIRLAAWLNLRPETVNYYEPRTFQTLRLRNRSAQPLSVVLASEVLAPGTGQPVTWFASPQIEVTGGLRAIVAFADLAPGAVQDCVLPVYVHPETPAGNYHRRVTVTPLGSDTPVAAYTAPLGVTRSNAFFTGWTLGVAGLSLAWLAATLAGYRALVRRFGLRLLVLLALLGSLQFAVQFAGGLLSTVSYAVLGPFNSLVGGLFSAVLNALLMASIVYLVPRVGAMTLAGLITYLMGVIMFGSFNLTDLLFVGSGIAFREVFLYLAGVTRLGAPPERAPWLPALMLALASAEACSAYTSLVLQAVFFRLHYAPWYMVLHVGVAGFLYPLLGVYLSRSLGHSLRQVHL